MGEGYRIPKAQRIGLGKESKRLYNLEEEVHNCIESSALEYGRVSEKLGHSIGTDLFRELLPQTLYDLLDSYDDRTAISAACAYLRDKGFKFTVPDDYLVLLKEEE